MLCVCLEIITGHFVSVDKVASVARVAAAASFRHGDHTIYRQMIRQEEKKQGMHDEPFLLVAAHWLAACYGACCWLL